MERSLVSDVAKVHQLWQAYIDCLHSGDFERWMALWIEDGIQMPPEVPRRLGVAQIRAAMQPWFDNFNMSNSTIYTEEVRIIGDRAYSHGTYTYDLTPKAGGQTRFISGKFLDILVKQADGSWKIAIDCHNYNEPVG
jgi:uncharacterized protein (TIGR02246 family)